MDAIIGEMKRRHEPRGARFAEAEGRERLLSYSGFDREYGALEESCALFDLSDRGLLEVTGEDRVRFLNNLLSNDIMALAPGQGCAAALLDRRSKVQALMNCLAMEESILLETEPGLETQVAALLARYKIAGRVEMEVATGSRALFSLQGPWAPAVAQRLFGLRLDGIPRGGQAPASFEGFKVHCLRLPRTGRPGLDVLAPVQASDAIWTRLEAEGGVPSGWDSLEAARVEAGIPRYGDDVTAENLMAEAGLADSVSYSKGCYVGQEVVARVRSRGHVNRIRSGLLVQGPAAPGDPVATEAGPVSKLTSARFSPRLGGTVAFAYLKADLAGHIGTECRVITKGGEQPAMIVPLPFINQP